MGGENIPRKITYELVKSEFDERGYILLSNRYIDNSHKLQYICPKHVNKGVLETTFGNFTKGNGCPHCSGRVRKTQEEYEAELAIKKPMIRAVGRYVSLKTKIEHMCTVCGYHWNVLPDNMLHMPNGCPKCGKRAKLNKQEVVDRLANIDPFIEFIGEYIDSQTSSTFRCKRCGKVWLAKPNNILNGKGCPHCKMSKGELRISKYLDNIGIGYSCQKRFADCRHEAMLPFDFYIEFLNICIEYDGLQHFEPCTFGGVSQEFAQRAYELCKIKDSIKTQYCQDNGIKLIRIPYWEFDNIEEILSSSLH